jgi:C1A family cysteine protease
MQNILRIFGYNMVSQEELELQQTFVQHMSTYGISYGTEEEFNFRMSLFAKKDAEINEINATEENFTVGHNFMSTWTDAEYKKILGYAGQHQEGEANEKYLEPVNATSKDWRADGAVNAIKNQAQCGSCWAFSATCAAEGAHFIKTGELLSLSEQELVSCSKIDMGCNGGLQSRAFFYLEHHQQELEAAYPYTSGTGVNGKCLFDKAKGKVGIKTYTNVPANSVEQLKAAIDKQPVAVTIEADKTVFQQYTSGVMDSKACGTSLDHAVAAVGYGTEGGQDYYIVRNSWGASWGDAGYIKIAAVEGKGICGIQMQSLYPEASN